MSTHFENDELQRCIAALVSMDKNRTAVHELRFAIENLIDAKIREALKKI